MSSIRQSVRAAFRDRPRVLLGVSGGLDSMVLFDAAVAAMSTEAIVVATFDHGTGDTATAAASLVQQRATERGVDVHVGRADAVLTTEAEWRRARWHFLRTIAQAERAAIATAHTLDDQIETVLMRVLRGAGARGLAGLFATSDILRPLLRYSRHDLVQYARARGLSWIEDPSNLSPRFFRNRVRHDLLPALRRVRPRIDEQLVDISRRAARWRASVEEAVERCISYDVGPDTVSLDVAAASLIPYSAASLSVLWPALAAKAGLALDRRGTQRLVTFTQSSRIGARIQLSGQWEVTRSRDRFELRRSNAMLPDVQAINRTTGGEWGAWSFRPAGVTSADAWSAWLPLDLPLHVRAWRAGDVMTLREDGAAKKVKRLLTEAGISGHDRARWPVVIAGDQIVWIPGVRRGDAATERSGRPGLAFACEYDYR